MTPLPSLTTDPEELLHRYEAMFGFVPELPAARVPFVAELAPNFQAVVEALRADALANGALDPGTIQLILFAVLLGPRPDAAAGHAVAARRLGVGFEALLAVVELVALSGALGPLNVGGSLLARLRADEAADADSP